MGSTETRGYKQKLLQALELQSKSRSSLFRRVKLLVEVFKDDEFRADHSDLDDRGLSDFLTKKYLDEIGGTHFLDLLAVYEEFPSQDDWDKRTVRDMLFVVEERREAARKAMQPDRDPPKRITQEQFKAVEQAKKEVEARAKYLEREADAQKSEVERLREENVRLKQELAEERGRRMELERLLDKQAA